MVVSGVNLTVCEGEMVYFIGKVGSGKSSLIKTLYAEVPLVEGEGRIVGFDLRRMKRRDISRLRRSIGIVVSGLASSSRTGTYSATCTTS